MNFNDFIFEDDNEKVSLRAANARLEAENERLRKALMLMLDCVDYTKGSCGLTEMVGGALPSKIISIAREALEVKG